MSRGPCLTNLSYKFVARHLAVSFCFLTLYLLLTSPHALAIYRLGAVAWYPAIGLVISLLLAIGPGYAPLVALAVAAAGFINYQQDLNTWGETFGALTLALSYAVAAYILRGPLRIDLTLQRRRDVVRYIFVVFSAAAVNSVIGTACLAADRSISWQDFWPTAWAWFFGDGIALVAIAPFLLVHVVPAVRSWVRNEPKTAGKSDRHSTIVWKFVIFELLTQLLTIGLVVSLMFSIRWGRYHTFFLAFVPIIWIAMRQGMRRVVVALVILDFAIVVALDLIPPPIELLSKISLLMLVVSCAGLVVGSEVSERSRTAADLNQRTTYLNALIENSPLGIVVFNQDARVEFANPAFEKLLLYKQKDLAIGDIATLWLEGIAAAIPNALSGENVHLTVRQRRKDGRALDLALHAVPLKVQGHVRGVYAIYQDISEQVRAAEAERKYSESQRQLVEELQLRTRQMSLLNDMGAHLQGCASMQEASAIMAQSAKNLFPEALSGALYLPKLSPKTLELAMHFGGEGGLERSFRLDACASLRRSQPNWNDLRDPKVTCYHLQPDLSRLYLCVPIAGREETFGVFHLEFPGLQPAGQQAQTADAKENWQQLAVTVAGQMALSLAAVRLRENLRDQAIRDPLTGLYNRRFLEESLARELERATRRRHPVSLLFLDLDHFKRFNDTFGHAAGDVVLRSVAVMLRTFFRASDICCRVGGEEFAVILPEAAPESAVVRANALRLEVKAVQLAHEDKPLGRVSISIGVAAFPDHASTPQQLLQVADDCLYKSKARGRDMATLAGGSKLQQVHDPVHSQTDR
jgi:diguanylate cyclase (GGDEF)-like protein/PAS domain S-box-containing protein